mgnify:CR=1 FL=1
MKKLFLFLFLCSWAATGWAQRLSPGTTATAAPAAGGGGGTPFSPAPCSFGVALRKLTAAELHSATLNDRQAHYQ